jgi:hypothetical protein
MLASSLYFVSWCLSDARENTASRRTPFLPPLYLAPGDAAATQRLNASQESRDQAVLCLPYLGSYMPRETGRTVYLGHWAETLRPGEKLSNAARFYGVLGASQMSPDEARAFLRESRIGVVVMGFHEKQLGARLPLELPLLLEESGTEVYGVPR